jgi:chloramphenicol-sensitive protein RarD
VPSAETTRSGLLYGLIAYLSWGVVPLYFSQLKDVPAAEILAHRIAWSVALVLGITAVIGGWRDVVRVFASRRLVLTMLLSSVLLAGNWLLYISATVDGKVTEASLGYYMMPLVNAFLATLVLKEKLRPAHYPALALVGVGVATPFIVAGDFTWYAVALPVTFGFYGLVRKRVDVDSMTGLSVEAILLLAPSVGFLVWKGVEGTGHFGPDMALNGWLAFSSVVTVIPLLTFTLSIRRLPLLANSLIQFLSPTMQFLLAVYWLGESMSAARWAAIGCVWAAVAVFVGDALAQARAKRREAQELECAEAEAR